VISRFRAVAVFSMALFAVSSVACSSAATATQPPETAAPTPTMQPADTVMPTLDSSPTARPTVAATGIDSVFIQLIDPLDEPQFYCVDVPGSGTGVRLNGPLQAHTCKPIVTAEDELFAFNHPGGGQIFMEAYGLCVEAADPFAGSTVLLEECSDSPDQRFTLEGGIIKLDGGGQADLCLAIASGAGIPTGGPSHLRRDLTLENCATVEQSLSQWITGIFDY